MNGYGEAPMTGYGGPKRTDPETQEPEYFCTLCFKWRDAPICPKCGRILEREKQATERQPGESDGAFLARAIGIPVDPSATDRRDAR